ncbi:MAG: PEGA domain-containing protein [Candidatus Omnitrophica bacterium]|nr:PEGA domain-containing protein [Candidatus Omnitrophota bacterium]
MILYAMGYLYKPGGEQGVVKAGLIALASVPSGASIYMNESRYTKKTPTVIYNLLPGEYAIRLELDNHKKWEKKVPVEAEKATVLDKIILLPDSWEKQKICSTKINQIIPIPKTNFFLAAKGDELKDWYLVGSKDAKYWPLIKAEDKLGNCVVEKYFLSEEGSNAGLFYVKADAGKRYLFVLFNGENSEIQDITALIPEDMEQIKWLPNQENKLFVFHSKSITRIDLDTGAVYPKYIPDVKGYGLFGGQIYLISENNEFLQTDYNNNSSKVLMDDKKLGEQLFGKAEYLDVKAISNTVFLFLSNDGKLVTNKLPYQFMDGKIKETVYDNFSGDVICWQKDKIGVIDFLEEETGNVLFETGPAFEWAYEKAANIKQAFWVYNGSHILFLDRNRLFFTELEEFNSFATEPLFEVQKGSLCFYSEDTGKIYYLDASGSGQLYSSDIIPGKGSSVRPFSQTKEGKKIEEVEKLKKREIDEI